MLGKPATPKGSLKIMGEVDMQLTFLNTKQSRNHTRRREMFVPASQSPHRMTETARLTREIRPGKPGRLRYQATEWNAESIDNAYIPAGTIVQPITRKGNTWFVAMRPQVSPHQVA